MSCPQGNQNPDLIAPCSKIKAESIYTTGNDSCIAAVGIARHAGALIQRKENKTAGGWVLFLGFGSLFLLSYMIRRSN